MAVDNKVQKLETEVEQLKKIVAALNTRFQVLERQNRELKNVIYRVQSEAASLFNAVRSLSRNQ